MAQKLTTKQFPRKVHLQPHQKLTHGRKSFEGNGRPRTSWWTDMAREDFTAVAALMVQPEIKVYKTRDAEA